MKRDAWIASWEESRENGDAALDIYPYPANDGKPGTVAICVNDERFDAVTVATLDEIIAHLAALRIEVFGAPKADPVLVLIDTALEQYKDALAVATRRKKQVPATASQDIDSFVGAIRALEALKVAVLKEPK